MTLHTRTFAAVAILSGLPSVSVIFSYAINSDLIETGWGTGILFTYSSVLCVGALLAAFVSSALDLFSRD